MRRTFAVLSIALAITAGCSASTQGSGAGPRSSSNLLTRQEISASAYQTASAYEAVEKLRPAFFRLRATSAGPNMLPTLFVDGIRRESLEQLRTIPASEISEIRYLSVQDATTRYGLNVPAGVLDVKLLGR